MVNETSANPFVIALMFLARCMVPMVIMLGISYLLRKLGLLKEPTQDVVEGEQPYNSDEGLQHGKA